MKILSKDILSLGDSKFVNVDLINSINNYMTNKPKICGHAIKKNAWRTIEFGYVYEKLLELVSEDKHESILDFGCGRTPFAPYLKSQEDFSIEAYDSGIGWGDVNMKKIKANNLQWNNVMNTAYGCDYAISEFNKSYDIITSVSVIEHIISPVPVMEKIINQSKYSIHTIYYHGGPGRVQFKYFDITSVFKFLGVWDEIKKIKKDVVLGVIIEN